MGRGVFIFLLAASVKFIFLRCSAEIRAPGLVEDSDNVAHRRAQQDSDPDGLDADEILGELRKLNNPRGGTMAISLKAVAEDGKGARNGAKHWRDASLEAILALSHTLVQYANVAELAFLHDGLLLGSNIRNNLLSETGKMTAVGIDGKSAKENIKTEMRARATKSSHPMDSDFYEVDHRYQTPDGPNDDILNRVVKCSDKYTGPRPQAVHHAEGVVVAHAPCSLRKPHGDAPGDDAPEADAKNCYRVKLSHQEDFMPIVTIDPTGDEAECKLDPTRNMVDGMNLMSSTDFKKKIEQYGWRDLMSSTEWTGKNKGDFPGWDSERQVRMATYGQKSVYIFHTPVYWKEQGDAESQEKRKETWMNQIGTIVDFRHHGDYPEFKIRLQNEASTDQGAAWLQMDTDFMFVEELQGKKIQIDQKEGKDKQLPVQVTGTVGRWHAKEDKTNSEGETMHGYYNVTIPKQSVNVAVNEIRHLDNTEYQPGAKSPLDEQARYIVGRTRETKLAKYGTKIRKIRKGKSVGQLSGQ